MKTLTERIATNVFDHKRLRAVPIAVIEDVLAIGIDWLSNHVPMNFPTDELSGYDFESCESCGHLIDPEKLAGAVADSEGVWLCDACLVEELAPQAEKEVDRE